MIAGAHAEIERPHSQDKSFRPVGRTPTSTTTDDAQSLHLLGTKLVIPPLRTSLVPRPRLGSRTRDSHRSGAKINPDRRASGLWEDHSARRMACRQDWESRTAG